MNKVIIYLKNNNVLDFESNQTKKEILEEIFAQKIYGCQFANKFVAINTDNIMFIEIK